MPPKVTSGIRVGTPAATTRGFDNKDFIKVGEFNCRNIRWITK
jgi:glycine/serine hydroxymethyltransferase